ncbi:MAG: heme ABC transporter ATP-binding protein, partial [Rubrimonas sp.]
MAEGGMLEARDVRVLRGGRAALDGVSLRLRRGAVTALCGPNGAGKSTLLSTLCGDVRPDAGLALIDGRPVRSITPRTLAGLRAVLEQSPTLAAPFTVAQLVGLGADLAPRPDPGLAARAMAAAGVAHLADRTADRLSGGERARAHLARALAQLQAGRAGGGGLWLLLDEPTASLDLSHQITVMRAARRAAADGAGVLVVLHDLNLAAAFADRVVLMAAGRIVADGPPADALRADRLSALYG